MGKHLVLPNHYDVVKRDKRERAEDDHYDVVKRDKRERVEDDED